MQKRSEVQFICESEESFKILESGIKKDRKIRLEEVGNLKSVKTIEKCGQTEL